MNKQKVHKRVLTGGYIVGDITILCGTRGKGFYGVAKMAHRWKSVTCGHCLRMRKNWEKKVVEIREVDFRLHDHTKYARMLCSSCKSIFWVSWEASSYDPDWKCEGCTSEADSR